jgi:uncharacterized protein (DUF342 family)
MSVSVLEKPSAAIGPQCLRIDRDLTAAAGPVGTAGDVAVQRHVGKDASLRAGGSVKVGGYVDSAFIACGGELRVSGGAIKGGKVVAHRGIVCKTAGDSQNTPTELQAGFDERFLDFAEPRVAEVEKAFDKAQQFRTVLEPMLKDHKALTAEQKEQVSDLLCRAGEAKKRAVTATQQLKSRFIEAESSAKMEFTVTETLFPGVVVCFPGTRVVIDAKMSGPVKLSASRGIKGVTVHATQTKSGKSQVMKSVAHVDRMETIRAAIAKLEQN